MKRKKLLQFGIFFISCLFLSGILTGCGADKINVVITDCQTESRLFTKKGQTVEELLEEAEITVGGEDTVSPDLGTEITLNNMQIVILRHARVSIDTEEKTVDVELTGGKVKDALKEAEVTLVKNDYVNHDMEVYLTDGMSISIVHRLAVSLTADGKIRDFLSRAHTVEEFLQEQNIELGKYDRVKPKLTEQLSEGTKIVVKRVEIKELVETEPVPFETEVTYSGSMLAGTSRITREGINGEKRVTYEVTYVDGKEESRKAVKEVILKEAVNQLVMQGTKPKGKTVISRERVDDCDGSGHGYYIITYSDGSVEYQDY